MELYNKYGYIHPPRPEQKVSSGALGTYDNGIYLGQPKLNGSCCNLFINDSVTQKGRYDNTLTNYNLSNDEVMDILNGKGWNVLVGEYMNKSKKDEFGQLFNHKFVIFDKLVHDSEYLLGSTFDERVKLMLDIYKPVDETKYLYKLSENIWMVKTFYENFGTIWEDIVKTDMLEGFVMKRKSAKLQRGTVERNNHLSQFKCRKSCKSYVF